MSNQFKVFKETSVPSVWSPNSVYFVGSNTNASRVEIYVTSNSGVARRIIDDAAVNALIDAKLSQSSGLTIVNSITERDAISSPINGSEVLVLDASSDSTVTSGNARYIYNNTSWVKTSESESMDLVLNWDTIVGKPNSTATQIDNAVSKVHEHSNMTQLSKINEDGSGNMTYNGKSVTTSWVNTGW